MTGIQHDLEMIIRGRGRRMIRRFWTRKCGGCADPSAHDSHLTWFGSFYFRWRFR